MYSIPPKQFAIFSNFPKKYSSKSVAYNWGGNVTTLFSEKKGVGGIIFGAQKGRFTYGNTPPCLFLCKGVGGIYEKF